MLEAATFSMNRNGFAEFCRLSLRKRLGRLSGNSVHNGIDVAEHRARNPAGMQLAQELSALLRHQRLDERSLEDIVELGREFREAFNRREVALVVAAVVVGENVGEGALVEADGEVRVDALATHIIDRHLVKAGRKGLDRHHSRCHFGMLFFGDRRGDEDAEMADLVVHHVDDALAADLDFLLVGVGVEDPVERLLGRRDVVAERGEDDDRRTDPLQIDGDPHARAGPRRERACCR